MKSQKVGNKKSKASTRLAFPEVSTSGTPANRGRPNEAFTAAELASWIAKAKDLPDIRWDKVAALREAIRDQAFDADDRLSRLSEMLPEALLAFCQRSRK